jgi:hypothetical protein
VPGVAKHGGTPAVKIQNGKRFYCSCASHELYKKQNPPSSFILQDLLCAMKMDTAAIGAPDNAEKVH